MYFRWLSSSSRPPVYDPVDSDDEPSTEKLLPHRKSRTSVFLYSVSGFALGAFLTLLALKITSIVSSRGDEPYDSPVPDFPRKIHHFSHGSVFSEVPSSRSDAAWGTLEGPTFFTNKSPYNQVGHIRVDGSARYDGIEPAGLMPDGTQKYSVSYAHQLHCLGALRRVSFELLDGSVNTTEFMSVVGREDDPSWIPPGFGLWHLTHCLDYLRQALQCAGDTALEWPRDFAGTPVAIGWDIPHKCVDWNELQQYMEDNG